MYLLLNVVPFKSNLLFVVLLERLYTFRKFRFSERLKRSFCLMSNWLDVGPDQMNSNLLPIYFFEAVRKFAKHNMGTNYIERKSAHTSN